MATPVLAVQPRQNTAQVFSQSYDMTMTAEHFRLHRAIAQAIDDRVPYRHVWVGITIRAPRDARLDDPEDLARFVSEHLQYTDADDLPTGGQSLQYDSPNGRFELRLHVIRRERTLRNDPSLPLVLNPYPAVAGDT